MSSGKYVVRPHLLTFTLVVLFGVAACHSPKPERRPNVLVVTMDTTRVDHLGSYGYVLAHTPNLDRLAREGIRGTDHASVAPITMPAHTSIMTGLLPPAHGVRDNGTYALSDDAVTLAERFHDAGFETHAFISAVVLARRYNLAQGFDTYDDDLAAEDQPPLFMIRDRPSPRTTDRLLAWLDTWGASSRTPFFTWVHFFDPHQPYERHTTYAAITPTPYDAEIAMVDESFGRIVERLRALGELDNTIIVVTADHGESLGEHGEKTHAIFIYDATIHVPLIVRGPGLTPRVYDGATSHVDIAPTLLSLTRLPGADSTQGIDLSAAWKSGATVERPQYCESMLTEAGFGMAPLAGVRSNGRKYIRAPRPELYDLRADPKELHNLLPADVSGLETTLDALLEDSRKRSLAVPTKLPSDNENMENLMALGYVARPADRSAVQGLDPKDGLPIYEALEDARHAAQHGRWDEATKKLEALLAANPRNVSARDILGLAHFQQGNFDAARRDYEASLAVDPNQGRTLMMLGRVLLTQNEVDKAREIFERARTVMRGASDATAMLGYVALRSKDNATADRLFGEGAARDPNFAENYRPIGDLAFKREDYAVALMLYERLLLEHPTSYAGLLQGALAAIYTADDVKGAAYLQQARDLRPDSWLPIFNQAWLAARHKDTGEALRLLDDATKLGFNRPEVVEQEVDWAPVREATGYQAWLAAVRSKQKH